MLLSCVCYVLKQRILSFILRPTTELWALIPAFNNVTKWGGDGRVSGLSETLFTLNSIWSQYFFKNCFSTFKASIESKKQYWKLFINDFFLFLEYSVAIELNYQERNRRETHGNRETSSAWGTKYYFLRKATNTRWS